MEMPAINRQHQSFVSFSFLSLHLPLSTAIERNRLYQRRANRRIYLPPLGEFHVHAPRGRALLSCHCQCFHLYSSSSDLVDRDSAHQAGRQRRARPCPIYVAELFFFFVFEAVEYAASFGIWIPPPPFQICHCPVGPSPVDPAYSSPPGRRPRLDSLPIHQIQIRS